MSLTLCPFRSLAMFGLMLGLGTQPSAGEQPGPAITLAGFGARIATKDTKGDTWDGAWLADDRVLLQYDDGFGWGKSGKKGDMLRGIGEMLGTPDIPAKPSGTDLNPGKLGNFLSWTYTTGLYEVDGVLYIIKCRSDQTPGKWRFFDHNIFKSLDGGATWINHLGQTNTVPDSKQSAMFPGDTTKKDPWSRLNFVKYGRGGSAPDMDGARTWVYLNSDRRLARIKRSDLPSLDFRKFQYYLGGDGMLDGSWSDDINKAGEIAVEPSARWIHSIVFNPGLRRYITVSFISDSWQKPEVESILCLHEAPHPWGPWKLVLEENVNFKEQDNLTWTFPLQKFISPDGFRMWMTVTGKKPYGLQYMPIQLTTAPVQTIDAATATLKGTKVVSDVPGAAVVGCVSGFAKQGDECLFQIKTEKPGSHLVQLRYHTTAYQTLDLLVNGSRQQSLRFGKTVHPSAVWSSLSFQVPLQVGANTIALQATGPADIRLDRLSLAWSNEPGAERGHVSIFCK